MDNPPPVDWKFIFFQKRIPPRVIFWLSIIASIIIASGVGWLYKNAYYGYLVFGGMGTLVLCGGWFFLSAMQQQLKQKLESRDQAILKLELFRSLVDQSNNAIFIVDADSSQFLDFNEQACRSLGYPREELLQKRVIDIDPRFLDLAVWKNMIQPLEGEEILVLESRHRRKNKTTYPVEIHGRRVTQGGKNYVVMTTYDISERKKTEAILREKANLATVIEKMDDMVEVTDAQVRFLYVNPSHERNLGYSLAELKGRTPAIFRGGAHSDEMYQQMWETVSSGNVWKGELIGKRKDGLLIPMDVVISPVKEDDGKIVNYVAIKRNISERKAIEAKLQQYHTNLENRVAERTQALEIANEKLLEAKEKADQATLAKSEFLANMSHEIRTPLNAINGFSQILLSQLKTVELPPKFQQYLENINLAGHSLTEIINSILDFSKIEAGKFEVFEESIPIHQLIRNLYQVNVGHAQNKNVQITYQLADDIPDHILTDRPKLTQILTNLLNNALKFTPSGKTISIKVFLETKKWIVFKVADQGIGISPDRLKHIFNAFEQEDSSITRRFGGTGLGLAITEKLVSLLEGSIEVTSEVDQGTTFLVKIPFVPVEETDEEENEMDLPEIKFSSNNRVLLIEDNPINQAMIQALFEGLELTIDTAGDGEEGVRKTLDTRPDLVLMDLHMPNMSGLEATKQIRSNTEFQQLPIIALSADAFHEQQKSAFQAGVSEYLTKPLEIKKLLPLLAKYLKPDS